jgi:hypothetical protein
LGGKLEDGASAITSHISTREAQDKTNILTSHHPHRNPYSFTVLLSVGYFIFYRKYGASLVQNAPDYFGQLLEGW